MAGALGDEDDYDAQERQDKTAELAALRDRINALRADLQSTRDLHDSVRTELRETERAIGNIVSKLQRLKRTLNRHRKKLKALRRDEKRYAKDLDTQRKLLGRQIGSAYVIGRQEYVKLLLNQEDPAAIGRVMTYYDYFNKARSSRIQTALDTLDKMAQVKSEIKKESIVLRELRAQQLAEKKELEKTTKARAIVIARLRSEISDKGKDLDRMLEDEQQLQELLAAISEAMPDILAEPGKRKVFAKLKGKLIWPTKGKVRALFGRLRQTGNVHWNGIMIVADEGRAVRSVSHGRVAYAEWLRGYGLLLIIDHGEGYMSLYGHNQTLHKETGDWVEAGEVIASVGSTGGHVQAGLYFEIRKAGKPINPTKWCKKNYRG